MFLQKAYVEGISLIKKIWPETDGSPLANSYSLEDLNYDNLKVG